MVISFSQRLRNLFEKYTDHNCFACSSRNQIGLKLEIVQNDENCFSDFILSNDYTGFPNIIHGGIQATVIDEVGFWAMYNKYKTIGFTTRMTLDYLNKLEANTKLRAIATKIERNNTLVNVEVKILNKDNAVGTIGNLNYKLVNDILLKKYFGKKFYEEYIKIKNEFN
jgi:acyl-coenzyme A thioesterase PaaI-like protein|tara:strand:- start:178 stop:681 length:504 start_codon:yes stop_codon:yes gene_type:complete